MFKKIVGQKKIFEFHLTSNPRIPEYQDLAFCLRIPTLEASQKLCIKAGQTASSSLLGCSPATLDKEPFLFHSLLQLATTWAQASPNSPQIQWAR
jgi:hypothetical protein